MKDIILWGAAGQAIVLEEFLQKLGYKLVAVFDSNRTVQSPFEFVPIYYGMEGFREWMSEKNRDTDTSYIVTVGVRGEERLNIHKTLEAFGLIPISVVHPTAFVANSASVSVGCQILAHAAVCARTSLDLTTIVNTSASVDHGCVIGKGVHIAPGVKLGGCIEVGDFSLIGIGAVIIPEIKIGKKTIIGAGSVVTRDIPDNVVAYGNPAKVIRDNNTQCYKLSDLN
ncbi:MAG: NeuD/PglB/VioB family sugar acetyltransferase [Planctomycetota bacterium]|jgi:sugar O-acyltransferase (sialic acid O-acetyltransferase NeuD family)